MKESNHLAENMIHLKGMEFYGYHGVLEEENDLGQRFLVDLDITPLHWAGCTDSIDDTVNYAEVFAVVRDCVENKKFKLLETLAEEIASRVLEQFACTRIRVEIHKPNAPIPGIFSDVSVEILREKKA